MTGPMEHLSNSRPGGAGQPAPPRRPGTPPEAPAPPPPSSADLNAAAQGAAGGNPPAPPADPPVARLWPGDPGTLPAPARRALAALVRGPHVSAADDGAAWRDLVTHLDAVRSRLADLYLDLVLDHDEQIAFVRDAAAASGAPPVVRELPLTFADTVLLLHLRSRLLEAPGSDVVADLDDVMDELRPFRRRSSPDGGGLDGAGFDGGVAAGWKRLADAGILRPVPGSERRAVISPVLRTLFGAEEIEAVRNEYARFSREGL
ncbi:DUF4194 domain-containing protein [Myceligenerans crystallogenes]|uniref:DUF4194 domain-containing protein n=1 Tax=Myceligenerans crystallogenes TaxID=316335 RepID=A0ABN2NMT8_9MICO